MKNVSIILFVLFSSCHYFEKEDEYKIIREDLAQTRAELEERIVGNTLFAEKEFLKMPPNLIPIKIANEQRAELMDLIDKLIGAAQKNGNKQMSFDYKMLGNELMNYRALMLTLVQDSSSLHAKTLNVNADSLGKSHFSEKTGKEISVYLNKITLDVLLLNEEVISRLISESKKEIYPVDSLEMRVLAKSSSVKKGESFRAEILYSAYETNEDDLFFVADSLDKEKNELAGNIDTIYSDEENDSRFFYSFMPKKAGDHTLYFMGKKKLGDGAVKKFPVKVKFKVK